MLITTGSGTSAKQGPLKSNPGARLTRKPVAVRRAPPLRAPLLRASHPGAGGRLVVRPSVVRPLAGCQPTARPVAPMAGAAGPAACCRVGTLRQGRRRLTRKLARSPWMCRLAAASEIPPSARAMAMPVRGPGLRSRAGRGTRTPPLMRRPPRCRPALRGPARAGRGQTTTGRSPAAARACRSRARRGRRPARRQPGAVRGRRRDPVHHGRPRRSPARRGSRRRSGLGGLPAIAARNVLAVLLLPHLSAPPPRRQPRRQRQSRPRQSGRRQSGRRQSGRRQRSPRRQSSEGRTTARLLAARRHAAGAGIPF
jgi:hypothetical protein